MVRSQSSSLKYGLTWIVFILRYSGAISRVDVELNTTASVITLISFIRVYDM
jgi:hypothetical protein